MSNTFTRVRALAALLALASGGVALVAGGLALPIESQVPSVQAHSMEAMRPAAAAMEVRIDNFTFSPATLTVAAGTTVT